MKYIPRNGLWTLLALLLAFRVQAQVNINYARLSSYNVTPQAMLDIGVSNSGPEQMVTVEATLQNANMEIAIQVVSQPFTLKAGMNSVLTVSAAEVIYGTSTQAQFIRNSHRLPAGKYRYCCVVKSVNQEGLAEFCEEVESDITLSPLLLSPYDKETIHTFYPILTWNLNLGYGQAPVGSGDNARSNEYYRLVVVELEDEQNADAGVKVNQPILVRENIASNQLQYPFDAPKLKRGKRYGWQIQKFSNGIMADKSEPWEFNLEEEEPQGVKYAVMGKTLDAGYVTVKNDLLYFRFEEEYTPGQINCHVYNSQRKEITPEASNENNKKPALNAKAAGYNRYELDLSGLGLRSGFYTLEVMNEKKELYLLKFKVD